MKTFERRPGVAQGLSAPCVCHDAVCSLVRSVSPTVVIVGRIDSSRRGLKKRDLIILPRLYFLRKHATLRVEYSGVNGFSHNVGKCTAVQRRVVEELNLRPAYPSQLLVVKITHVLTMFSFFW